jgi:hypothetical protein
MGGLLALSFAAGEAGDEGAKAEKKENALALETTTATATTPRRRGRIFLEQRSCAGTEIWRVLLARPMKRRKKSGEVSSNLKIETRFSLGRKTK